MLTAAGKLPDFRSTTCRLKTSQTVIARIEIGERRIDVIEFIDLARVLRIDPREVVTQLMR
jgi:hypothetical protein